MIKVAHRGLAGLYPENTLISFEKSMDYAPDAIELDVQLTKDNVLVVFHDEDLFRTTGVHGYLKDYTYSDIKELNANNGFLGIYQKVPTLDEYFDLIGETKVKTFIELKNSFIVYEGIENEVFKTIKKHNMISSCIIYSANHYSVMKYKEEICPESEICFPFDNWIYDYGKYCENKGVKLSIPYYKAINKDIVDDFHKHGVKILPWTVDSREKMLEMSELGVDGLLTNRIDILSNL